jgi:hypothetical protein
MLNIITAAKIIFISSGWSNTQIFMYLWRRAEDTWLVLILLLNYKCKYMVIWRPFRTESQFICANIYLNNDSHLKSSQLYSYNTLLRQRNERSCCNCIVYFSLYTHISYLIMMCNGVCHSFVGSPFSKLRVSFIKDTIVFFPSHTYENPF